MYYISTYRFLFCPIWKQKRLKHEGVRRMIFVFFYSADTQTPCHFQKTFNFIFLTIFDRKMFYLN